MTEARDKVLSLAEEVASSLGCEIEDVELLGRGRRMILRIIIDKEGGVDVEDCSSFSRDMSAVLDVEDHIEGSYTLEVSSPGLDRPLKNPRQYRRHLGKEVRLVLSKPMDKQNVVQGIIEDVLGDGVVIRRGARTDSIPFSSISKARLVVEVA